MNHPVTKKHEQSYAQALPYDDEIDLRERFATLWTEQMVGYCIYDCIRGGRCCLRTQQTQFLLSQRVVGTSK